MIGPTERLALLGVVECVLVRRTGDAERLRADGRAGRFERRHRRLLARPNARSRAPAPASRRDAALPPSRHAPGIRTSSSTTSAVWTRTDAVLEVLLTLAESLRAGRDHERGVPAALQLRFDGGDDDVHVGDAAIGDPRLGAVEHPLVGGLVVHRPRAQARHIRSGVGLADAERAELHLVGGAVALRHPLHRLLGRAGAGDPRRRESRPHDRHADAGVTPEQLLDRHRQRQAGGITHRVEHEVEPVQADLRGLFDDRERELLALVPLVGGGTDHGLGEVVDPLLDLQLVLVEVEREVRHGH